MLTIPLISPPIRLLQQILAAVDETTRLIFVCTPGNPTAKCVRSEDVIALLEGFQTGA